MKTEPRRATASSVLTLAVSACVGLPPSPPQDAGEGGTGSTSHGDATGSTTVGSTGPVADGAASSSSGTTDLTGSELGTTAAVDPSTTTGDPPAESTGSGSTGPLGSSSSEGGTPASCDDLFGAASGYVLCMEDASSCSFNVNTGGNSCTTICGSFGAVCIHALDNPAAGGGQACVVQGDSFCDNASKADTICVCAK